MPSWFQTGKAANQAVDDESDRRDAARDEAKNGKFFRFWIPSGGSTRVTFVDDDVSPYGYELPFTFWEHQLKIGDSWKNWFTCVQGTIDPETNKPAVCPLCQAGHKPSLMTAYTVIDHSEWTGKKGDVHKDEIRLFVCKTQVAKTLRKAANKKKGLRGWTVEISRIGKESPNTGDQFDFEERKTLDATIVAPDYLVLFLPKSMKELQRAAGNPVVGSSAPERSQPVEANDDNIRF